jgi:hypothetical protein
MSNTPTPGLAAYVGFWGSRGPNFRDEWPRLPLSTKARWEAAAQAVLAQCTPQEDAPTGTLTHTECLEELRRLVGHFYAGMDALMYQTRVRQGEDVAEAEQQAQEDAP